MKLFALAVLLVVAVVACKAMLPDYIGVSVSQPLGDGTSIDGGDGHGMFGSGSGSFDAETYVALVIGYSPGDRVRHREHMKAIERAWKKNVAAVDRNQFAFLTGKLVADQGDDALGDPVGPDLSNPIDVIVTVVPDVPKTLAETLMLLGWAIALAIVGVTYYFLRKQHIKNKKAAPDG